MMVRGTPLGRLCQLVTIRVLRSAGSNVNRYNVPWENSLAQLFLAGPAFDGLTELKHLSHVHRFAVQRERHDHPDRLAIFS
jgi:hypothetical protein